jgi:hypothetical protein
LLAALPKDKLRAVFSSPEQNASAIMKAVTLKNPKVSYSVGLDAKIVVARFKLLPTKLYNGLLRLART